VNAIDIPPCRRCHGERVPAEAAAYRELCESCWVEVGPHMPTRPRLSIPHAPKWGWAERTPQQEVADVT
jgi:hypothetical protein